MNWFEPVSTLLAWYDRCSRSLPWRRDRDPYRVWVSEVMLQQTRVETVIPYYEKFLERFPDAAALAAAEEEQILGVWQGLGYYSRARNLHQGVREVVNRYGGQVPAEPEILRSLPGIGAYTAGALLSIAHNRPEPAVDGNVLRVFSRFLLIGEPVETAPVRKRIEQTVRQMLEGTQRRGDFTQALMELGALICLPRTPRCGECPWSAGCEAFRKVRQTEFPVKKAQAPPKPVNVYSGIFTVEGKVLTEKRPNRGILRGMWQFPSVELASDGPTGEMSPASALAEHFRQLGFEVEAAEPFWNLNHVFSHREWRMQVMRCTLQARTTASDLTTESRWLERHELPAHLWAGPHRKIAHWLFNEMESAGLD